MDLHLSAVTGLTVTARIYTMAGATVGSSFSVPEISTTGEYAANMPGGVSAGEYLVVFSASGEKIGSGVISWDGTKEVDTLEFLAKVVRNKRTVLKVGNVWTLIVYDDNGTTPILSKPLKDILGSEITDLIAGVMATEEKSSV